MKLARVGVVLVLSAIPVFPCGGPGSYPIDAPLLRVDRYFTAVENLSDGWDSRRRHELRFLYPFRSSQGVSDALWGVVYPDIGWEAPPDYDSTARFLMPDTLSFVSAIRRGDHTAASASARQIVDRVLALPASETTPWNTIFRRSVEWLDLAPTVLGTPARVLAPVFLDGAPPTGALAPLLAPRRLPGDSIEGWTHANLAHPRRATLEFAAIQVAMRRGIPNGWANEIRDSVSADTWYDLEARHESWLSRWPEHTLRPWVELSKGRLAYFRGDTAGAWEPLFARYALGSHRARVLSEMRYLVMQGVAPAADDPRVDDRLRTALLLERRLDVASWTTSWRGSLAQDSVLRVRTQERLLYHAARPPLSDSLARLSDFPVRGHAPSPLWGRLRAVGLARGGRIREALATLASMPGDSVLAPLRAHLLLHEGRWFEAITAPLLPVEARQYLIRVMAPDSVLALLAEGKDKRLAAEAKLARAVRLSVRGAWSEAVAALPPGDRRITAWRTAVRLSADTTGSGRLAWARWLNTRHGTLFHGVDRTWYRSLNWRLFVFSDSSAETSWSDLLPWTREAERLAIAKHLMATQERSISVRVLAEWLKTAPTGQQRSRVLTEANTMYNWLVNWDNNNSRFFLEQMERDGTARIIRAAGRAR